MPNTLSRDGNVYDIRPLPVPQMVDEDWFNKTNDELQDWHDFFVEDDQRLPTDLMVAMIDRGLIIRD